MDAIDELQKIITQPPPMSNATEWVAWICVVLLSIVLFSVGGFIHFRIWPYLEKKGVEANEIAKIKDDACRTERKDLAETYKNSIEDVVSSFSRHEQQMRDDYREALSSVIQQYERDVRSLSDSINRNFDQHRQELKELQEKIQRLTDAVK